MASVFRWAWLACRALFVMLLPIGALLGAAALAARVEIAIPSLLELAIGSLFAFTLIAGTFAIVRRMTDCLLRPWWLPFAYAGIVVLGPPVAIDGWHDLKGKETLAVKGGPAEVDVLLIQPPRWQFGLARQLPALTEMSDDLRHVRFSVASPMRKASTRLRLHLPGGDRSAAFEALATSLGPRASVAQALPAALRAWPIWRPKAAHAIVLNVDGIHARVLNEGSTNSRPADWAKMLGSASKVPVYAILDEADDDRLREWQDWTENTGGEAVRFRDAGRTLLVDAALRLATERSDEFAYEALAWRHRPRLRFDTREPLRNPLDIEKFLSSGKVEACRRIVFVVTCVDANEPDKLPGGAQFFSFDRRKVEAANLPGAIYYHAVRRRATLYLDYWWYFPFNPTPVGGKTACRPGLTTPGVTCFDHASDWEGITVVLRKVGRSFVPRTVIYAQHEFGVAYDWAALRSRWEQRGLFEGDRPIVYVARDSHASYPMRCDRDCTQIEKPKVRKEGRHDGRHSWRLNDDDACRGVCLKRMPQARDGNPVLWNASPLPWGKQNCFLATQLCTDGAAPRAPAYQARFEKPGAPLGGRRRLVRPFVVRYAKYDSARPFDAALRRLGTLTPWGT
jgi:hypothetical protein